MAEYFYGITDKGKRREKNEDTFFAREIEGTSLLIAGVVDGVGGYRGGEIAAEIARCILLESLEIISGDDIIASLRNAIIAANKKIIEAKKEDPANELMACVLTCVVADKKNHTCRYAHVGDTRIYLLRDHSLVKLSKDHSVVGFLEESGRLSEEEAMRHPRRNEINKAVGFEEDISSPEDFIETGESPFLPGDQLLLCSDGLTDMISSEAITSILTSGKDISSKARSLIDAANEAGGNDNITAVLVINDNPPKEKPGPVVVERKNVETVIPVTANEVPNAELKKGKKKNHRFMAFMAIIFIGLGAVLITAAFLKNKKTAITVPVPVKKAKQQDHQFTELIAHVRDTSKGYSLMAKAVIPVSVPVTVSKDSFYLRGNGAVLMPDSLYKGPAFIIDPAAKNMVVDSLVFENFDVGLVVQKNNITFRHVRFINCRIPVQYVVAFKDSVISGKFNDSIFITRSKSK